MITRGFNTDTILTRGFGVTKIISSKLLNAIYFVQSSLKINVTNKQDRVKIL